jgi:biotin carboxyl carrier protein
MRGTRDLSGSAEVAGTAGVELGAEDVHVFERLIIAPASGTFHPSFPDVCPDQPAMIAIGDEIGVLVRSGEKHTVESPFTGLLIGLLVLPGERVLEHQPVAWLTTDDNPIWG